MFKFNNINTVHNNTVHSIVGVDSKGKQHYIITNIYEITEEDIMIINYLNKYKDIDNIIEWLNRCYLKLDNFDISFYNFLFFISKNNLPICEFDSIITLYKLENGE
jgi:hypothetical protein